MGHSPSASEFAPFWASCQKFRVAVCFPIPEHITCVRISCRRMDTPSIALCVPLPRLLELSSSSAAPLSAQTQICCCSYCVASQQQREVLNARLGGGPARRQAQEHRTCFGSHLVVVLSRMRFLLEPGPWSRRWIGARRFRTTARHPSANLRLSRGAKLRPLCPSGRGRRRRCRSCSCCCCCCYYSAAYRHMR